MRHDEPTFRSLEEVIAFTRAVADAEGTTTPELDALLAGGASAAGMETADPLAGVARDYAIRVAAGFAPVAAMVEAAPVRPEGPDPVEVVLFYHVRIYLRLVRALIAKELKSPCSQPLDDAAGSAKLVLVAIQKSRAAFRLMREQEPRGSFDDVEDMLDTLESGIDDRFPEARAFMRVGLDIPAG